MGGHWGQKTTSGRNFKTLKLGDGHVETEEGGRRKRKNSNNERTEKGGST